MLLIKHRILSTRKVFLGYRVGMDIERACPICGKTVVVTPGVRPRVFCSGACRSKAARRRRNGELGPEMQQTSRVAPRLRMNAHVRRCIEVDLVAAADAFDRACHQVDGSLDRHAAKLAAEQMMIAVAARILGHATEGRRFKNMTGDAWG